MSKDKSWSERVSDMEDGLIDAMYQLGMSKGGAYMVFALLPDPIKKADLLGWIIDKVKAGIDPTEQEIVDKAEELSGNY